jgi:integrase
MASIGKDPNGRKRILFVAEGGSRPTVRLGKASMKQANAFKVKLEALLSGRFAGSIDDETARWIADLPDDAHAKLAAVGLVEPRKSKLLGPFLEGYLQGRTDVKPATLVNLGHTQRNMIDFFGSDKPLRDITEGDADLWRIDLQKQGLSDATVRKRCRNAKQFFRAAIRHKLVACNPFDELKSASRGNKDKEYFLRWEDAQKVLEACPSLEWRLLFALARFGGLRTPSEPQLLKWSDIDWERGRFLVHSPKTEHHPGGASRLVPLFPELRSLLLEAFDKAQAGDEYVIQHYRNKAVNLRTHFQRIIRKAGLEPWPKLWQNLRSTRQTELSERWPQHVVCAWLGNSQKVAQEHYLQVLDEHFEQASEAAQNPAQYPAASSRNEQDEHTGENEEGEDLQEVTSKYGSLQELKMGPEGLEPSTNEL